MDLLKNSLISQLERTDSIKQSFLAKFEESDTLKQSVMTRKDSLVLSASDFTSKIKENVTSGITNIVEEIDQTVPTGLKEHINQIASDTNSFLSASGITSREPSTASLTGSAAARENGTADAAASDSITLQTRRVASINRGASFDGYTNSGNSYGDNPSASTAAGAETEDTFCSTTTNNSNGNSNFNDQLTSSLADINSAFPNSYLAAKVRSGQLATSTNASSNSISNIPTSVLGGGTSSLSSALQACSQNKTDSLHTFDSTILSSPSRVLQQQQQQQKQQQLKQSEPRISANSLSPSRFHATQSQMDNSYSLHHHYPNFPTVMDQQSTTPKTSLSSDGSQVNNNNNNNKHLNSTNLKRSQESLSSESSTATIGSGGARPKQNQRGGINYSSGARKSAANQLQSSPKIPPFHHNEAPFAPSSTLPFSSAAAAAGPSEKSETADTSSPEAAAFTTKSHTLPFPPQSSRGDSSLLRGAEGSPNTRPGVDSTDGAMGRYTTSPGKSSLHGVPPPANRRDPRYRPVPMEYQDPQSMPYYAPMPHPGAYPGARSYFHQYFVDHCGPMPRPRRMGMGTYHRQGSRYPPGFYPIDNTHQLILYKVDMLNRNARRKFLMTTAPGAVGGPHVEDNQLGGALPVQEFSPDNSEHAATLSSESERSHRSHHLDDDLDEGNRRSNSAHVHKQNSSDNYEHEQPQRRSSPHGDSTSDGLGNSTSSNAGDGPLQAAGSNSSLQHDNLELGSRPSGYSCSVPATPEHKKNSNWMQHPRMQFPPHMTSLHESYGLPQRHRRGGEGVPYGGYKLRHPVGGPHMPAGGPYRHPAQYRSLPPQSFGYYPPRFRGRPMPPGGFPSSRYSSQEDFRGSSKSLAIYPSEYHSSALDMHEQSQAHPRFASRSSRISGSRESLDVQMQAAQNRESRSLSKSYPAEGGTRQPRASSLPPPEDHLGEDEQVLNLVEPLSSSHVPSLVNTLTPSRSTHNGGEQLKSITPIENPVSPKKEKSKRRGRSSEVSSSSDKNSPSSKQEPSRSTKKSNSTSATMHLLKSSTNRFVNKRLSGKEQKTTKGANTPDSLFTSLFTVEDHHLSFSQSERDLLKIPKQPEQSSSSYLAKNPKTASAINLTGASGLSSASARGSQASLASSTNKRSSSQNSLVSIGSAKEKLRKSGKRLSESFQKLTTHKKASVSIRDPKDFESEFCEATSREPGSGKCSPEDVLGSVKYSLNFEASTKVLTVGNLAYCEYEGANESNEKEKLKNSSIYLKATCALAGNTLNEKTEKQKILNGKTTFPEELKFELPKPKLANVSLRIMVLSKSPFGKDPLLGEIHEQLDERTAYNRTAAKYPLTLYAANENKDIGTIKLSVRISPTESVSLRVSVQGLPKKGSSEPNTYCKLHLLPLPTKFKSKGIVKHTSDPVYLETFVIPFRGSSLSDFCLELCIVYCGPANVKSVLGGVRLCNGTATYQGAVAEWMQSTIEEISFWQRLQNSSGEWVQGHLRLRSNFNPLK